MFNNHFWDAEPGVITLAKTGTYQIRAYASADTVGNYAFKLWPAPAPEIFSVAVGGSISNNIPAAGAGNIELPGAIDLVHFTNSAGQTIFFDTLGSTPSYTVRWSLDDALGNRLFDDWLSATDPGYITFPIAGTNTLVFYCNGDGTGTYAAKLWSVPQPGALGLALGDVVTNNLPATGAGGIESPGAQDLYVFTNAPGQLVFFDMLAYSASLRWAAFDATGARLFDDWMSNGDPGRTLLWTAGTNLIRVYGSGQATGGYSFKVWNVPSPEQFAISVGSSVTNGIPTAGAGNIEQPGAEDSYSFTNDAGQAVYFDIQTASAGLRWTAFDAQNNLLFDQTHSSGDPGKFTLPIAGTNRIRVYGAGQSAQIGAYAFRLTNAVPGTNAVLPIDRFSIALGTLVSNGVPGLGAGNIETNGAQDFYEFTLAAPGPVFIQDLNSVGGQMRIDVYDPNGQFLFWEWLNGFPDLGNQWLSQPGTYRIVVRGNGAATGAYSFQLWAAPRELFQIAFGDRVTNGVPTAGVGNIETPGTMDFYEFAGTAGQTMFIEDTGSAGNQIRVHVFDPYGNQVAWEWLDGYPNIGRLRLTESGRYRLQVWGNGGATGQYGFRLWNVPASEFALSLDTLVASNTPAVGAGVIETPGSVDWYDLTLTAGQMVFIEDLGSTGNQVRLDVYDPSGNFLFWEWLDGGNGLARRQFTTGGTYRLAAYGSGSSTGAYSFRVRSVPPDQYFQISVGDTVTNGSPAIGAGQLETAGAWDIYRFEGQPGQLVFFEDLGGDYALDWEVWDSGGSRLFYDRLDGGNPGRHRLTRAGTHETKRILHLAPIDRTLSPVNGGLIRTPPEPSQFRR